MEFDARVRRLLPAQWALLASLLSLLYLLRVAMAPISDEAFARTAGPPYRDGISSCNGLLRIRDAAAEVVAVEDALVIPGCKLAEVEVVVVVVVAVASLSLLQSLLSIVSP